MMPVDSGPGSATERPSAAELSFHDLSGRVRRDDRLYRMLGAAGDEASIVLRGDFFMAGFRSGLQVHATDAVEQMAGATEVRLPPQLSVSVVLEGAPMATLDDVALNLPSGPGVRAKMWSVARPAWLRRHLRPGQRVRKVNVSVSPGWIEGFLGPGPRPDCPLGRFARTHLAMRDWTPSKATVRAAEEMLLGLTGQDMLSRLSLEIRALAVLHEALAGLERGPVPGLAVARGDREAGRAQAVWTYIHRHLAEPLTLGDIAAATGMSVSTVQRAFKEEFGLTVVEHLRLARLDLARKALAEDGLSIQQAAHVAGYTSAANFSTAFKRRFGHPPSEEPRDAVSRSG